MAASKATVIKMVFKNDTKGARRFTAEDEGNGFGDLYIRKEEQPELSKAETLTLTIEVS